MHAQLGGGGFFEIEVNDLGGSATRYAWNATQDKNQWRYSQFSPGKALEKGN